MSEAAMEIRNYFSEAFRSIGVMECWSARVVKKKNLFMITVWSLLIAVPSAQGIGIHSSDLQAEQMRSIHFLESPRESILLAENEHKADDSQSQAADEYQSQAAEPNAAVEENTGKQADGAVTKPLKPFKPSEEIAAEQAVDFPVDI
jgi:hypothetical protein